MNEPAQSSTKSFFATVLIVNGILWMSLTGLCTALVAISSILGGPAGLLGQRPGQELQGDEPRYRLLSGANSR